MRLASRLPSAQSRVGRLIRKPLSLVPSGLVVPVLTGAARGSRWIVGHGVHGYWLGTYEATKQAAFAKCIQPGAVVYDIGAHLGFYTVLASRLAGPAGKVIAFEPWRPNLTMLYEHIDLNQLINVTVMEVALTSFSGQHSFSGGTSDSEGRLSDQGFSSVNVRRLDDLELPPPSVVKIDVEGEELGVLDGGAAVISRSKPIIFLATHSPLLDVECRNLLADLGYQVDQIAPGELLALPGGD